MEIGRICPDGSGAVSLGIAVRGLTSRPINTILNIHGRYFGVTPVGFCSDSCPLDVPIRTKKQRHCRPNQDGSPSTSLPTINIMKIRAFAVKSGEDARARWTPQSAGSKGIPPYIFILLSCTHTCAKIAGRLLHKVDVCWGRTYRPIKIIIYYPHSQNFMVAASEERTDSKTKQKLILSVIRIHIGNDFCFLENRFA